jgi:hypothetical protein
MNRFVHKNTVPIYECVECLCGVDVTPNVLLHDIKVGVKECDSNL